MPNFKNGKIYKISDVNEEEVYIGSTSKSLCVRMANHKGNFKLYQKGKHGKTKVFEMFEKYGVENCKISLLQRYPCKSREELNKKEGEYIKQFPNCVNKNIAGRKREDWVLENQDKLKQIRKEWLIKNPEYPKTYYQQHKEKIDLQIRQASQKLRVRSIVQKLNSNAYKRVPYSKIKKHNIKFNETTKLYHL
jgi:hypothetical protein